MSEVLGRQPDYRFQGGDPWMPIALFAPDDVCVANVDVSVLTMIADGQTQTIAALRSVAVAEPWRGRGLFRGLMQKALVWCDARAPATILYTEEPMLYARFDFSSVDQHAFVGPSRDSRLSRASRILDLDVADDRTLVIDQINSRAWPSRHVALAIDAATLVNNARGLGLTIAYVDTLAAIIVYEESGDEFALHDVIAKRLPRLEEILESLPTKPRTIRIMFPTDQLGWTGHAEREDTGLLIRGKRPSAFDRPFMIAPTAEF